ncbi:nucleotidyl transferase AbiEii/AbiGii toxin family protein, partial [bacterium]|nr:nucleotidyl transferase AbiEii/AbiGii toxin family protein [bacterium]
GGTSLSKAYNIIKRFSEDVDVTIDYRDFVTEVSKSQEGFFPSFQGKL